MKMRTPMDKLGRLAGLAEPPPIDDATARQLVELAMRTLAPQVQETPRTRSWTLAFAVAAAAAMLWWLVPRASVAPAEPSVMHVTLPTGDRLVGVGGARFDVERLAAADRRLRLTSGTVLFDVAHLVADQRFRVATAHLVATAKGTVFSVETDATSSQVRVYEGIVEVEQDGATHALGAGAVWNSATHTLAIALQRPAALAASVEAAVGERVDVAAAIITPPTPAPPPIAAAPPASVVPSVEPHARPRETIAHLLETARADVAAGKLEDALETARVAAERGPWDGAWWQLVGDASRGLGRAADAADAFDHAAHELTGVERGEAGYSAAYLRFHDLIDGERALASLDASGADADGAPLEERASGLRVQILVALGRHDAARARAARYLEQFPNADLHAYMLALTQP